MDNQKQIWHFVKSDSRPFTNRVVIAGEVIEFTLLSDTAQEAVIMFETNRMERPYYLDNKVPHFGTAIYAASGAQLKPNKKALQKAIHEQVDKKCYFDRLDEAFFQIKEIVKQHGFDDSQVPSYWPDATRDETNRGSWEITNGATESEIAWLTVTWYQMGSGRWEIVAYVS